MLKKFIVLTIFFLSHSVFAENINKPTLTVITPNAQQIFTQTQLLNMPSISQVSLKSSRAYPNTSLKFTAIKMCELLKSFNIKKTDTIELVAADNFSSLAPAEVLITCDKNKPTAYLAIETKNQPWPPLEYNNPDPQNAKTNSAGPFMIIWQNATYASISPEYWAWQLVKIKVHSTLSNKNFISAPAIKNEQIQNGYQTYMKTCVSCHTMNQIGQGTMGPDLNIPMNPVEYFKNDEIIKKFIRNPQNIRIKKDDKMPGFGEDLISNNDLENLILYLHYMSTHKKNW